MEKTLKRWVLWFLFLVLSAFIVPFTLLREVHRFVGSFLFFTVFALISIASVGILTKKWRD